MPVRGCHPVTGVPNEALIVKCENLLGCHFCQQSARVCACDYRPNKIVSMYLGRQGQPWLLFLFTSLSWAWNSNGSRSGSSPSQEMTSTHHHDGCSLAMKTGLRSSCLWEAILSPKLSQPLTFVFIIF